VTCAWCPHLLNLLGKQGVAARVVFSSVEERSTDRKVLAVPASFRHRAPERGLPPGSMVLKNGV